MKKFLLTALCLCLMLSFAGCSEPPVETSAPTTTAAPAETTVPETTLPETTAATEPPVNQLPMTAISLTRHTETETAEDGTVIFEYVYQDVRLIHSDPAAAEKVTLELLNRMDSTRAGANEVLDYAKINYSGSGNWYPYSYGILYAPTRIDQGLLSLFGNQSVFQGGMHGSTLCVSVNYDLTTGETLMLGDILSQDCTADVICRLVVDALYEIKDEKYIYDDYSATVEDQFAGNFRNDDGWYLSQTGLCFYFSPYEVAPYASGVITAEIPYSALTGILLDQYFPAEQIPAPGTVEASLLADAKLEDFTQLTEVILDKEGEEILLHTDGLVYDISIDTGTWNADGTVFTMDQGVFAASSLSPGDGILVQASIPDTMPNLRLRYRAEGEIVTVYISQSGKDSSILLLEY